MNVVIHRGTQQIGGCITEIKTKLARIIIDFGMELNKTAGEMNNVSIDGVTTGNVSCDGIFFTHYHGDHMGDYPKILPGIPFYMGEATKEIYVAFQERMHHLDYKRIENAITFSVARSIEIKDIKITPFLVDHSAYDAYMFLVEAEGKKILHTGDFRTHGPRGKGVLKTIEKYIGTIDLLIIEGTTIARPNTNIETEQQLANRAKKIIKDNKYVFILCASTNIDRIVGMYHATPRGKYFMCDAYQKKILHIIETYGKKYSSLYSFNKALIYGDNLLSKMKKQGCCMLIRDNPQFKYILDQFEKESSIIIYSMWSGYLENPDNKLKALLEGRKWIELHTSGHASQEDIKMLCNRLKPRKGILPIHTERPGAFEQMQLVSPIIRLKDGEVFIL